MRASLRGLQNSLRPAVLPVLAFARVHSLVYDFGPVVGHQPVVGAVLNFFVRLLGVLRAGLLQARAVFER